jgi:hypothetical protein
LDHTLGYFFHQQIRSPWSEEAEREKNRSTSFLNATGEKKIRERKLKKAAEEK